MASSFHCPNCNGPLDTDGRTAIVRCPYCNSSVVVPPELRGGKPHAQPLSGAGFYASADIGFEIAENLEEVMRLVQSGNKIEAIKLFRETFGVGLKEAKDAIYSIDHGGGVNLDAISVDTPLIMSQVNVRTSRSTSQNISTTAFPVDAPSKTGSRWLGCGLVTLIFVIIISIILPIILTIGATGGAAFLANSIIATAQPPLIATATPAPTPTPSFMTPVLEFGGKGSNPGQFDDPRYIALDGDGNIYIAEYSNGRIQKFDPQGKFLIQWMVEAKTPVSGFDVARDGVVYLTQRNKIWRFDGKTGQPMGEWPVNGNFRFEALRVTPDGGLIVISNNEDVIRLDASAQVFLNIPKAVESVTGDNELETNVAIDGLGNIYLSASFNHSVLLYNPDGRLNNRFGERGNGPGQLNHPGAIAVDGSGRIFVASGITINVFSKNGLPLGFYQVNGAPRSLVFNDAGELFVVAVGGKVYKFQILPSQ